jgi:hypothetical protein
LVGIYDTPFLISGTLFSSNGNILSFSVFVSFNLHDSTLNVDNQISSESEELCPVTVCSLYIDLVVVKVHGLFGFNIDDGPAIVVENPFLGLSVTSLVDHYIIVSYVKVSSAWHL